MTLSPLEQQAQWYASEIDLRGAVIVDVGANVGALSEALWREAGPDCTLHCVEPLAENLSAIQARIPAGVTWHVHPVVVTGTAGADGAKHVGVRVEQEGGSGWNCSVLTAASPAPADREVRAARLIDLVPDATVVKLDVEGHEYAILNDALASMPAVHAWAIEFHFVRTEPLERALQSLHDAGYALRAAGRRRSDPQGAWVGASVPPTLSWNQIPAAQTRADGSVFKMLHIIARRPAPTGEPVG